MQEAVWYNIPISRFVASEVNTIAEHEAQIEALWTYEIAMEKVLRRYVKKSYITPQKADKFYEKLEQRLSSLEAW